MSKSTADHSLDKRQRELTESNGKILDWAMKIVSNKKKVSLPQIKISDYMPYTVVPQGVTNPPIPFSNPNPDEEGPSKPCKHQPKIKPLVKQEKKN